MKRIVLSLIIGLLAAGHSFAASADTPLITVTPRGADKPAAVSGFFRDRHSGVTDPRDCRLELSYDRDFLYIAAVTQLPPEGKLKATAIANGTQVIGDDTLELLLLPPQDKKRDVEQYKFGFFQILVNPDGFVFTTHHEPGYGLASREWPVKLQCDSKLAAGNWTLKLAIPWRDLGCSQVAAGEEWRLLAARNFKQEPASQSALCSIANFTNTADFAIMKLGKSNVRQESPRTLRIPSKAHAEIVCDGKKLSVAPGRTAIDLPECRRAEILVTDAGKNPIFRRTMQFDAQQPRWTHLGSHLRLLHDFRAGLTKADYSAIGKPNTLKRSPKLKLQAVSGHQAKSKAVQISGSELIYPDGHQQSPGNISCWVKMAACPEKGQLIFASDFNRQGYFGLMAFPRDMRFFMHHFSSIQPGRFVGNARIDYTPGDWMHFSVNFQPDRIDFYFNGIKRDTFILKEPIVLPASGLRIGENLTLSEIAVYDRPLTGDEIKLKAQEGQAVQGRLAYLPSQGHAVVEADLTLPGDLELQIHRDGQKIAAHRIASATARVYGAMRQFRSIIPVGRLAEGKYVFKLAGDNGRKILLEHEFPVKHYAWENNNLGRSGRIIPPYTPITAGSGDKFNVLLRSYDIAANGFPRQIEAMGKNILSAPIVPQVSYQGKNQTWRASGLKEKKVTPAAATYQAVGESENFRLQVNGLLEYDGLLRFDCELSGKNGAVPEKLVIDLPVSGDIAKLFHASGAGIRTNPAGFPPPGLGKIWGSRSIPEHNFIPFVWVGEDFRGLSYAADSDQGWTHSDKCDALELHRAADGTLAIRLNILNAPAKKAAYRFTIALQASPLKMQPADFRGWADQSTWNQKGVKYMQSLLSPPYWGSYYGWMSRYPAFGDMTFLQKLSQSRQQGKYDDAFIAEWSKRVLAAKPGPSNWVNPGSVRGHTTAAMLRAQSLHKYGDKGFYYIYTCNADTAKPLPEYPVYGAEWEFNRGVHMTASFADYSLYYIDKMLKSGVGGIYMDNTFFVRKYSYPTGDGYLDDNGEVQPSYGLWRMRDYIRRLATLMLDNGMEPFIAAHHTNGNLLPVFSFVTNVMGMEWKFGETDFQDRFTPDYIRTVNQGKQGGFFPTSLDGLRGDAERKRHLTRTMLAMLLPHEIRPTGGIGTDGVAYRKISDILFDFGIWQKDCTPTLYWDSANPVKSSDPGLLVTSYRRGKRILVVAGDYNAKPGVKLTCNADIAGVKNLETNAAVPFNKRTIDFPFVRHDLALLEITLR